MAAVQNLYEHVFQPKQNVCIRIEFNSQRISWRHQHGHCSFVKIHQHDPSDVTGKPFIEVVIVLNAPVLPMQPSSTSMIHI